MYCHECGQEVSQEIKFCPACGSNLSDRKQEFVARSSEERPSQTLKIGVFTIALLILIIAGGFIFYQKMRPTSVIAGNYSLQNAYPFDNAVFSEINDDGKFSVSSEIDFIYDYKVEMRLDGILEELDENVFSPGEANRTLTLTFNGKGKSEFLDDISFYFGDIPWYGGEELIQWIENLEEEELVGDRQAWLEFAQLLSDSLSVNEESVVFTLTQEKLDTLISQLPILFKEEFYYYTELMGGIAVVENEIASVRISPIENGLKVKSSHSGGNLYMSKIE